MKITRTKTPKGTNLYIVKSYRVKGKSTSKVVLKLGKLEELNEKHGDVNAQLVLGFYFALISQGW